MLTIKRKIQDRLTTVKNGVGMTKLTTVKTRDNFMLTRNTLLRLFQDAGLTVSQVNALLKKYNLLESTIPSKKLGADYTPEFKRLWQLSNEGFALLVRPDLAEKFRNNVPVWTEQNNSIDFVATLLKGANNPISKKAANDKYAKLRPLVNVLKSALKDKGVYPPDSLPELVEVFYNTFIAQAQTETPPLNFEGMDAITKSHLDESLVDAIVTYANGLAQRKQAGETLSKTQDKIANATLDVKDKLAEKAEKQVAQEIGGQIVSNYKWLIPVVIGVVLLIVYLALRK